MITPTNREIATTPARKVPAGATLWGGRYDGATIRRAHQPEGRACVVLLLEGGAEIERSRRESITWLHPASRTFAR